MTEEELRMLLATEKWYTEQENQVKEATVALALLLMMNMGSWRDSDWEKVAPEIERVVKAGATEASSIAQARINASRELQGVGINTEIPTDKVSSAAVTMFTLAVGLGLSKLALEVYSRLAEGSRLDKALRKSSVKLERAVTNSIQTAIKETEQRSAPSGKRQPKYTRVLSSGVKSHCMRCISDIGKLYSSPNGIVKFHDRCGCTAREVWIDNDSLGGAQHSLTDEDIANLGTVA